MSKRNLLYILINPFSPLAECVLVSATRVKPFVYNTFRLFSLSEWKLEIVLFRGINSRFCHAVLDTASQDQTILPLSKGEDRMLNERKRINSILGEGSSCRVNDRRRHAVLDTAPQEQASLEPYPSPLTGEGERSSDEGDIKIYPKRRACYGLSNLFKHNGRLKSTLHGFQTWHLNISEKGGKKTC